MIDAAFFRKMNPNYFRPHIIKQAKQDSLDSILFGGDDNSTNKTDKITTVKTRYKNVANKDLTLEYPEDILIHRIT
jgi:hypothetical protein